MSMGFENTVRIALSADDAAPIDAVIARIRELENVVRAMASAVADGTISNEAAVHGLAKYGREINQAKSLLNQFLQQQAAVDAGFETITGHIQASSDATKTFAKDIKDAAAQQAEASALLNALIASNEKEMNATARQDARETAAAKKKELQDVAADNARVNELIAQFNAQAVADRKAQIARQAADEAGAIAFRIEAEEQEAARRKALIEKHAADEAGAIGMRLELEAQDAAHRKAMVEKEAAAEADVIAFRIEAETQAAARRKALIEKQAIDEAGAIAIRVEGEEHEIAVEKEAVAETERLQASLKNLAAARRDDAQAAHVSSEQQMRSAAEFNASNDDYFTKMRARIDARRAESQATKESETVYQSWSTIAAAAHNTVFVKTREVLEAQHELQAAQVAIRAAAANNATTQAEAAAAADRVTQAQKALADAERDAAAAMGVARTAATAQIDIDAQVAASTNRGAAATTAASDRVIHATRSVYYASQAIQDLEYGFAAIVNNLPLIANEGARAMGLSSQAAMMWASGIALVGTAADIAWPHIKHLFDLIATEDVAANPDASLKRLEQRLEALKRGSWFIHIDPKEVEDLEIRVAQLKQKIDAANRAALGQTEAEQASGQRFKVAAQEFGGGTETKAGSKNVEEAIVEAMMAHPERFKDNKLVQRLVEARHSEAMIPALQAQGVRGLNPEEARTRVEAAEKAIRDSAHVAVGGALGGKAGDVRSITQFYDAFPGLFQARGIGDEFRGILGQAGEAQVQADLAGGVEFKTPRQKALEAKKAREQAEKDAAAVRLKQGEDAEKERQALNEQGVAGELEARQKFVDQPAQQVAGVLMQKKFGLQDAIDERAARMIAAGKADGDVRAAIRAFVAERVASSGVAAHLQAPAAENIFQAAMDKLEARIGAQGEVGQGARRAGARDIVGEIDQKRADDAQKAAAAAERERVAGNRRGAEARGLLPDADARLANQINRGQEAAERGQIRAQKQADLEMLFKGFEDMGYSQQQANHLAERSYSLWTQGFSVMGAILTAQDQLGRQLMNAQAQLDGLHRNMQRGNRARTHLNRGGGVQPGP